VVSLKSNSTGFFKSGGRIQNLKKAITKYGVPKISLSSLNIAQDTTAINSFNHRDGAWICNFLNDTCHLKGVGEERGKVDF
jgi:hypothetical protein